MMNLVTKSLKEQLSKNVLAVKRGIGTFDAVKITAKNGVVSLETASRDMYVKTIVDADTVTANEEITVNSVIFSSLVNSLTGETTSIKKDGVKILIQSGQIKAALPLLDSHSVSIPEKNNLTNSIVLNNFSSYAEKCYHALDNRSRDMVKEGFHIEISGNDVRVTALDGFRIATRTSGVISNPADIDVVIPGESLYDTLKNIMSDTYETYFSDNMIFFKSEKEEVAIVTLDTNYFAIDRMIEAAETGKEIEISKDLLLEALKALRIMDEKVIISIDGSTAKLESNSLSGTINIPLFIENPEKLSDKIFIKNEYLTDAVKAVDEDTIKILISDDRTPIGIKENGNIGELIMLMAKSKTD